MAPRFPLAILLFLGIPGVSGAACGIGGPFRARGTRCPREMQTANVTCNQHALPSPIPDCVRMERLRRLLHWRRRGAATAERH